MRWGAVTILVGPGTQQRNWSLRFLPILLHLLPGFRSSERCPQLGGCRPLPRSESSIERIRILVAEQKCHFRDIHLRAVEVLVRQFLPRLKKQLPEGCAVIDDSSFFVPTHSGVLQRTQAYRVLAQKCAKPALSNSRDCGKRRRDAPRCVQVHRGLSACPHYRTTRCIRVRRDAETRPRGVCGDRTNSFDCPLLIAQSFSAQLLAGARLEP
jgi:hypothetical protein